MPALGRLLAAIPLVVVLALVFLFIPTATFAQGATYHLMSGFTPAAGNDDGVPYTLGQAFLTSCDILVVELNYYRNPNATSGSVSLGLWSNSGTLLASVTDSSTTSGWHTNSISPVTITSGSLFREGYLTPNTSSAYWYSNTSGALSAGSNYSNTCLSSADFTTGNAGFFTQNSTLSFPGANQTSTWYGTDIGVQNVVPTATPTSTSTATATPTNTVGPTSTPIPVTCTNPGGTFDSTKGSQYEYIDSINDYTNCLVDIAIATQIAIPTNTPIPTATPIPPTATPTLGATPAAVYASTGCNPYDPKSMYQDCVIHDAEVRSDSYIFWTIPLILVAILAFGVTSRGRFWKR